MKTFKLTFFILLLSTLTVVAQKSETRSVGSFQSISVESGIDLHLTQDDNQSIKIVAKEDVIDRIITEVQGSTLKIYVERKNGNWRGWKNNGPMDAYVSTDYLKKLYASGGSDVESNGTWKGDDLYIICSGGSDIEMAIDVDNLEVECSGGSDVNIDGTAKMLELTSSGGSDFNGRRLISKQVNVRSSGGSDAYVHASEKLFARASGGSDIHYSGDPQIRDIDTSSSSDVKKY